MTMVVLVGVSLCFLAAIVARIWWIQARASALATILCDILAQRRGSEWTTKASLERWTAQFLAQRGETLRPGDFAVALGWLEDNGRIEVGRSMRNDSRTICYIRLTGPAKAA